MATNKGQFRQRTRTYHFTPATSAPGYSVIDIIDQAYRRLNEPSVKLNTSMASDRIQSGVFALRGLLDSINADPTLHQPPEYVSYDVPLQPTLTWGLGEPVGLGDQNDLGRWDINDQPPLEIKSLWFGDEGTSYEYGARGQLTEMSMADLARYRDLRRYEYTNYEPRRFFFEKTWPVRRLHFDLNLGRGEDDLTFNPLETINITWTTTVTMRPPPRDDLTEVIGTSSSDLIAQIERLDQNGLISFVIWTTTYLGPQMSLNFLGQDADINPAVGTFIAREVDPRDRNLRQDQQRQAYRYQAFIRRPADVPDPTARLVGDNTATSQLELLTEEGGTPLFPPDPSRRRGRLNGFVVKAFALPEDQNAVLNFTLNMPPGYFEYILCGLAIRLSSLSSKPLPQAILFAFNQAKFGLTTRMEGVEHDTDLGFITPRVRVFRDIDSL